MRSSVLIVMLAGALFATGCGKKSNTKEDATATSTVPAATDAGAQTSGAAGDDVAAARPLDDAAGGGGTAMGAAGATTVFYFDYDRSDVRGEYSAAIAAHARRLAANPALKARLEGNTDERGSREYNIALGERRAQAVRRALMLAGAGDAQLATLSYGEERPAVDGSDESAWAKNRRVELVIAAP